MDKIDKDNPPPLYKLSPDLIGRGPTSGAPHSNLIGIEIVRFSHSRAKTLIRYSDKLIGNPETGVVHGGVITTMLDHTSGMAVYCTISRLVMMATLDLRIDYMRPASPGETIYAECHCFKETESIAFVRGTAFHEDVDKPIATSVAAFMMTPIDPAPKKGSTK